MVFHYNGDKLMKNNIFKKNQKGFTLVEMLAVLTLVAILGAVALVKYIDMVEESRIKLLNGVFAAAASNITMSHANFILMHKEMPDTISGAGSTYNILNDRQEWRSADGTKIVPIKSNLGDFFVSYRYKYTPPGQFCAYKCKVRTTIIDEGPNKDWLADLDRITYRTKWIPVQRE